MGSLAVSAEEAAVVGRGGARRFEEGVEEVLQGFGRGNSLFVEASDADGAAHVEQLVAVVSVDLSHDLFVPVGLEGRLLHLPRHLLLQRLLHREARPAQLLLLLRPRPLQPLQLLVQLEVQESELL